VIKVEGINYNREAFSNGNMKVSGIDPPTKLGNVSKAARPVIPPKACICQVPTGSFPCHSWQRLQLYSTVANEMQVYDQM
jgi:hypothetical protein